ncbi:MAG: hypothetical protein JWQ35_440 [Bacteriovoracaceae bacterium]|nr:hypothetical protein [Bacteriovoracaceae bacterium]
MSRHFKIVAIGGGPAGISLAIECIEMGISTKDILVLEKGSVPIDAIRKFYPEKKMTIANYKGLPTETHGHIPVFSDLTKAETLTYYDELIKKYNIQMEYNSEVSKVIKKSSSFEILVGHDIITADFVAIGIGILGRPNKPTYKIPNTLRQNILYDITSQKVEKMKVLVIGGGDTSSEYCQVLVEEKNQVTLAYRGEAFGRMMKSNSLAVERLQSTELLKVWLKCEIKEIQDQGGRPHVLFVDESKYQMDFFDKVIFSIGGTTPVNFLKTIGVEFSGDWPKVGPNGDTNVPNLYLIGDLVAGKTGGSIIYAYNSAFRSATAIVASLK